jgi:hypothetical protein
MAALKHSRQEIAELESRVDLNVARSLSLELQHRNERDELAEAKMIAADLYDRVAQGAIDVESRTKLSRLLELSESNMSNADYAIIHNFLLRIDRPAAQYDPLIGEIATHFAGVLGMQEYLTLASVLKWPKRDFIKSARRKGRFNVHAGFMPKQLHLLTLESTEEVRVLIVVVIIMMMLID